MIVLQKILKVNYFKFKIRNNLFIKNKALIKNIQEISTLNSLISKTSLGFKIEDEDFFLKTNSLDVDEWQNFIEQEGIVQRILFKPYAFDTFVVAKCLKAFNKKLADSYLQFLGNKNRNLNILAHSYYLILLSECGDFNLELFLKEIDRFSKETYLPSPIIMNLVYALSAARQWDKALEYLQLLESEDLTDAPSRSIANGFYLEFLAKNNETKKVLEHFQRVEYKFGPTEYDFKLHQDNLMALINLIKHIPDLADKKLFMNKLFDILKISELALDRQNIDCLKAVMPNVNSAITEIENGQRCKECGSLLQTIELSDKDFDSLMEAVENKALKQDDIFLSSSPGEWKKFLSFLHCNKPFDFVFDGLNLYYAAQEDELQSFFHALVKKYPQANFLLLSRIHLKKHFDFMMKQMPNVLSKFKFFYVDNKTADDAFILYAALHSGSKCYFITKDYLRNHKIKMDTIELRRHFYYWQTLRQLIIKRVNKKIELTEAYKFHKKAQFGENSKIWHIPIEPEYESRLVQSSAQWLCVQPIQE